MSIYEYPHTNLNQPNLDYVCKKIGEIDRAAEKTAEDAAAAATSKTAAEAAKTAAVAAENSAVSAKTAAESAKTAAENEVRSIQDKVTQINNNTARLDELVSGDTPEDSEVMDGRVAYDNVTYPTIGDAERAQAKTAIDYAFEVARANNTELFTQGHLKEIPLVENSKFQYYKPSTGEILPALHAGTDFIYVDKDLYLVPRKSTGYYNAHITIQFYDLNKDLRTDIWVKTGATDNLMTTAEMKKFGFRIEIPEPMYIRVNKGNMDELRIFTWDGEPFGFPLMSTSYVPMSVDGSIKDVYMPDSGLMSVTIPREAKVIFAAAGYDIRNVYAVRSSGYVALGGNNNTTTKCFAIKHISSDLFYRAVVVKNFNYNYTNPSWELAQFTNNANECVSVFTDNYVYSDNAVPNGKYNVTYAKSIIKRAENINGLEWTCKADMDAYDHPVTSVGGGYKKNLKYKGIPYGSGWNKAHFFGWHISAHTFLSAANDPDSIFYKESPVQEDNHTSPYYSLVCSSFGTLAAGFTHPQTNFSMMHSPRLKVTTINNAQPGALVSNGYGHCLIYGNIYNSDKTGIVECYEQVGPFGRKTATMSDVYKAVSVVAGEANNYLSEYRYMVSDYYNVRQELSKYSYPLTVDEGWTPTNGSARPYKGDRCVYTSTEDVKINIKNSGASKLKVKRFNYNTSTGVFTSYNGTSAAEHEYNISGTSVLIPKADLITGAIYGVFVDNEYSISDPQEVCEYFEYYDVSDIVTHVSVENGTLVYDVSDSNGFWYAATPCHSKLVDFYWNYDHVEYVNVMFNSSGNYSDYLKNLDYLGGTAYLFRRGKFGAYVLPGSSA